MQLQNRTILRAASVCALLIVLATSAFGQGLYYREVPKDGKIYVFNAASQFEAFQKGTLPAKPIERLGWGPTGETVVFDSVDAVNLFAFKYGKAPEGPVATAAAPAKPPEKQWFEKMKVSGYLFGDAYAAVQHHDSAIEGQNGFWFRRGYLTFDFAIADPWSARFRLEANSPGDFKTSAKLDPFVKDAYLTRKGKKADLFIGIQPSPTWEFTESFWGYRSVEKVPLDLYRMGSSRDFGLGIKGKASDKISYHAMLGNGAGEGSETNEGKKAMLAVAFQPTKQLVVELYSDFENRPLSADRRTYQVFAGWKGAKSRYAVQYASQNRQVAAGPDQTLAVGSIFGVWDLNEKLSLLARVDRAFDPNPEADKIPYLVLAKNMELDFAVVGVDYKINKKISIIPNIEYVAYRDTNGVAAPDNDLFARITLYFQF